MTQPEALRLADELERDKWHVPAVVMQAAADELRGLHAERAAADGVINDLVAKVRELQEANEAFGKRQEWWNEKMLTLEAQRGALRAELKEATEAINDPAVNNLRTLAESIRMLSNQRDALLSALKGMLLHMGMDEDEWNKPTFDQARAAIKAVEENT